MNDTTIGYPRDASWHDHPNVTSPKKLHRQHPDTAGMAACNPHGVVLCTDLGQRITKASKCRRCWPDRTKR